MVLSRRCRRRAACCAATLLAGWALKVDAATQLLEFRSPSCGPCRQMQPIVDQLAAEGYAVREIDVTRQRDEARLHRVESWPTFIVLVDGQEQARLVGMTSHDQLVEVIRKATAWDEQLRQRAERSPSVPVTSVALTNRSTNPSPDGAPRTFADEPMPGRIVPLGEPQPLARAAAVPSGSPTYVHPSPALSPTPSSQVSLAQGGLSDKLIAATVLLHVKDDHGASNGTGTIVDCRGGAALILTCGHLFRESEGKGAIEVTQFSPSTAGAVPGVKLTGQLLHCDLERDLALIMIRPSSPVAVAPIAPAGTMLTPDADSVAVGCSRGENPTAWATKLTALDRYQGTPNVEAAGAPVEGRSGGGLFNSRGELIGVCFAAEPQQNEGLYASLKAIHAKLDELAMGFVYHRPAGIDGQGIEKSQLAASGGAPVIRGQSPDLTTPATSPGANWPTPSAVTSAPSVVAATAMVDPFAAQSVSPAAATTPAPQAQAAALSDAEQTLLEELQRRGGDAEVICLIRPRTPQARSEVIKLNAASPALVAALESARRGPSAQAISERIASAPGHSTTR